MLLYTIRSERMLVEPLRDNLLLAVVCGSGDEGGGLARDGVYARIGTGCWSEMWRGSFLARSCGR